MSDKTIDIVICMHNALEYVRRCLDAVIGNVPGAGVRILVVNDGSDEPTSQCVRQFCAEHDIATLIESQTAEGYTKAANKGMRESTADWVVLLNSDTVVSAHWLERIVECGQSDDRIGVVGPLSNAASYQSVPYIRTAQGDWSLNSLPEGTTVDDMAAKVRELSEKRFPRMPFINGFCYAIKRSVVEAVGLFDEDAFPFGFGEENDYSIRVRQAGFELAIADHAYVHHAKSKSYGYGRRKELTRTGRQALEAKHGADEIAAGIEILETDRSLERIRRRLCDYLEAQAVKDQLADVKGTRILYLLKGKGGGGGVHSIYQESSGMRKFGVHTEIALPKKVARNYERFYPEPPEGLFWFYESESELWQHAESFDIVVATIFTTVRPLRKLHERVPHVLPAYYIQDYEPWIIRDPTPELIAEAEESYTAIPDMVCFAKTHWIRQTVSERHGAHVNKVKPSLDTSVYHADRMKKNRTGIPHIVAMVRPTTPRRSPRETMEVLRAVKQRYGDRIRVTIFGNDPESPEFAAMPRDFEFENRGILVREEVADLLGRADVFADLSVYQAFGRTGLEAMAVGCATVLPRKGGVHEYAIHGENALVIDTADFEQCVKTLDELISDKQLRRKLKRNGLATASHYNVRSAVVSELVVLAEALAKKRRQKPK